tara:strand:- start:1110 stop:1982 length:873 start_codon:yes stop_codon:yes gene_type:complete
MELINKDCFDAFATMKDKSVDMFLLDLPFNCTALKWDKDIIDLEKMWVEIKRTMKPNAIIVMFCTAKFGYRLIHSNPKWFRYDLIWKKSKKVGFLSANKMPLRQHENIYVFKDKQGTYNPQKTEGKPYNKTNTGNNNKDSCAYGEIDRSSHLEGEGNRKINTGDRHPTSIIEDKFLNCQTVYRSAGQKKLHRVKENKDEKHPTSIIEQELENTVLEFKNPSKSIHRTQKPVELCEWLIRTYTNENDVVCDFTMGSGTVGVACINTKRQFIGVEKDEEIFTLAKNRINEFK